MQNIDLSEKHKFTRLSISADILGNKFYLPKRVKAHIGPNFCFLRQYSNVKSIGLVLNNSEPKAKYCSRNVQASLGFYYFRELTYRFGKFEKFFTQKLLIKLKTFLLW